ncbi:phage tail tape measure protein [Mesorhizobium xinjiangense]|uniref:hypothetical protein n=1 Tax=Mesorhizobium xinjiangense TaxID=2678685 RepID=UPI0012EE1AF3|nr:hypothetical protein [Mesorhizobium xinjiangense]
MAGSSVIGALRVNLGIDSAQFNTGLKDAQTGAERFAKVAKTAFAAVGAAAVAMASAFAVGVRRSLTEADDLTKMAQKIGIPIEELSKLKYAADLSGVSLSGLSTGVRRLSQNMNDAAHGVGEGAEAFEQLGINVLGADGKLKSSSQILAEIADRFEKMPDGAEKTALAMDLMGRSGADLIPLLNGGSAALNSLLLEAKAFGLEISQKTGKAAEIFNDNLARMSYALQGVTLSLTAALAPALVVVSEAMVNLAQMFVDALQYLPTLAEYAAVAGGALAAMVSPAILAAFGNLTTAIAVGLVGAVRALTAVIAANPLGALAVGIAAAVTAAYHFRDEIQKAIGVDVVQLARNAANLVIGSFVAAYEDIKFVWTNFPDIIGAAVIGAANAVIAGTENMINAATGLLDSFIAKVNSALSALPGGLEIGQIGAVSIGRIQNDAAARLSSAVGNRNAAVSAALNFDYIGEIGSAFEGATAGAQNFGAAVGGVNDELEDLGGSGGGGKKGGSGKAKKASDELKKMAEAMQNAKETLGEGFGSVIQGLVKGTLDWKDAIVQAGQSLLRYLNEINVARGSSGLFGGGLFQGLLGSLLGFRANGGGISAGNPYVVGERGPELIVPNTNGTVISNRDMQGLGGGLRISVASDVDNSGNITPFVTSIAREESTKAAGRVARSVDSQVDQRNENRDVRRIRPRSPF